MASGTPIYARRGYSPRTGEPITFLSDDRADTAPRGWVLGHFADGHTVDGHTLSHVSEPSWRCSAPVVAAQVQAVEDLLSERLWEDRREAWA